MTTDKGEVGSSSLPRPTKFRASTRVCTFEVSLTRIQLTSRMSLCAPWISRARSAGTLLKWFSAAQTDTLAEGKEEGCKCGRRAYGLSGLITARQIATAVTAAIAPI